MEVIYIQDLHLHSNLSDGMHTLEAMVQHAINMKFDSIGFTDHQPLPFKTKYSMGEIEHGAYIRELHRLQREYYQTIDIYIGMETEALIPYSHKDCDYTIVGVHHLLYDDEIFFQVDFKKSDLIKSVNKYYSSEIYPAIVNYYDTVVYGSKNGDILAHFDIITKFNQNNVLFDELSPKYLDTAKSALYECIQNGIIIEVTTGDMLKTFRNRCYPDYTLLEFIQKEKGDVIITSNAHATFGIGYKFAETTQMLKSFGFTKQKYLTNDGFIDIPL